MNRNKLKIKCNDSEDELQHPCCPHGPTLLFYTDDKGSASGYYACSAHRDKRSCNFHLLAKDYDGKQSNKRYDVSIKHLKVLRDKIISPAVFNADKSFCHTCNIAFLKADLTKHAAHELESPLTAQLLKDPTSLLRPLDVDKSQAQYFFDLKALEYFTKCFQKLRISKVICMGAPRLHTYLRSKTKLKSFLLDFDQRFLYFLTDDEYAWYNMCNNWFFDEKQEMAFHKFLKCEQNENLLIFTDPPFGCRTEPVACTLRQLIKLYNNINQLPHQPLPVFWIFPYYSEHYVREEMPELEMCDYMINYTNHQSYTDVGKNSRQQGSPVRIFTNIPVQLLPLPTEQLYTLCKDCERFVIKSNKHCQKCGICPSKNGGVYKHCQLCGKCVKSNYQHCSSCRRCTQVQAHNCAEYQANQYCWICLQCGHTEPNCLQWQLYCKRKGLKSKPMQKKQQIVCFLCGVAGHNERSCPKRKDFMEEFTFLGRTELKFKS